MTTIHAPDLIALVCHARIVPAADRESFAQRLRGGTSGALVVLETCHRVEAYGIGVDETTGAGLAAALPAGGRLLVGDQAIVHAIGVAVGTDSVVIGEDQILHQMRVALDAARAAGPLDAGLERLLALALRAGRIARSWQQGPRRSLADLALESIERAAGPLAGRDILVVGAGQMGRLAARAAAARGASPSIANRTVAGATAAAGAVGGRVVPFDPGEDVARFAGIVIAIGGPWTLTRSTTDVLASGSSVVVDLSVPAAVPAGLAERLGSRLIVADALARAGELLVPEPDPRLRSLIERTAAEFGEWQRGRAGRAAAAALVAHADRERETELEALWRALPDLDPDARRAIEGMTRHLAGRLLRGPLERLGRDGDGRESRAVRDLFAL
ncbi:MAG TPA: hypothetical protein VM427_09035 [Patescibacteria group bacterium]|nr:hypothetical protein [Patescibacteria group bacterium]